MATPAFSWHGFINTAALGAIGGGMLSLGAGHLNPTTLGTGALTGLLAAIVGFFVPSHVPPTNEEVIAAAAATAKAAANQEINAALAALPATLARHVADALIDAAVTKANGGPVPDVILPGAASADIPTRLVAGSTLRAALPTLKPVMPFNDPIDPLRNSLSSEGAPPDSPPAFQAPGTSLG